jgi:hypothetical protein
MEGAEPTRFFVIGAPKCGTTSLCSILAEHPEVGFSIPKEPRFFSHDEIYARGFDWYHGLFPERDGKQSVGEGSTSYATDSRDTVSAQRIHQHFPDAKLVYCVRHPLERIESIWMDHRISRHVPGTSYSESVLKGDFSSDLIANPGFIETSRYQARLAPYRALFPEEQIAVLFLKDRILAPGKSLGAIFDFLGISRAGLDAEVKNRANHISSERRFPNHLGAALRRLPGLEPSARPAARVAPWWRRSRHEHAIRRTADLEPGRIRPGGRRPRRGFRPFPRVLRQARFVLGLRSARSGPLAGEFGPRVRARSESSAIFEVWLQILDRSCRPMGWGSE